MQEISADLEYGVFDQAVMAMPVPMIDKTHERDHSSNNKQTNEARKIRKHFPETWLWNSTITGYAMLNQINWLI